MLSGSFSPCRCSSGNWNKEIDNKLHDQETGDIVPVDEAYILGYLCGRLQSQYTVHLHSVTYSIDGYYQTVK